MLLYLLYLYVSSVSICIFRIHMFLLYLYVSSVSICFFCIYMYLLYPYENLISKKECNRRRQPMLSITFLCFTFFVFTTNLNIPLKYYTILPHPLHTYQGLILLVSSLIALSPQSQYIHRLSSYHYSIQLPYRHKLQDNI